MIVLLGARARAAEARAEVISERKEEEKKRKEVKAVSEEEGGSEAPKGWMGWGKVLG